MSPEWFLKKIASQNPSSLLRRLYYPLKKAAVDLTFSHFVLRRRLVSKSACEARLGYYFSTRMRKDWFFRESDVAALVRRVPQETREGTVHQAAHLTRYSFTFRGHSPIQLLPLRWDTAPDGDLQWTRDLNRHGWFETLGFAYCYSAEDRFADAFVKFSDDWIEKRLGRLGREPWDSPFDIARRINAWIWSLFLFDSYSGWSDEAKERFLFSLWAMCEYLYRTVEFHSPGNHILLEGKTLAYCGELFPDIVGAAKWRARGWRILARELEEQIGADGVHKERSTMYHRIIAGELAELWLYVGADNSMKHRLSEIVIKMALFLQFIELGDGEYPLFGDSHPEDNYYRFSASAIASAATGRPLGDLEKGAADHTWWVLSHVDTKTNRHPVGTGPSEPGSCAFPVGGYYVSRCEQESGHHVLVWDCGPFGYEKNRKHAHVDALSFVLSVSGVPIIIDPGSRASSSRAVRFKEDLRRTSAHNTIRIDGEDQAVVAERGELWHVTTPQLLTWVQHPHCDIMSGFHDGYRRLKEPVRHTRTIVACHREYWCVLDRLDGEGEHLVEQWFYLSPDTVIEMSASRGQCQFRRKGASLNLYSLLGTGEPNPWLQLEEREGDLADGAPQFWPGIKSEYRTGTPCVQVTLLTPNTEQISCAGVEWGGGDQCTVTVAGRGFSDIVRVDYAPCIGGEANVAAGRPHVTVHRDGALLCLGQSILPA